MTMGWARSRKTSSLDSVSSRSSVKGIERVFLQEHDKAASRRVMKPSRRSDFGREHRQGCSQIQCAADRLSTDLTTLTGTLTLAASEWLGPGTTRRLFGLPNGLHFRKFASPWFRRENLQWIIASCVCLRSEHSNGSFARFRAFGPQNQHF